MNELSNVILGGKVVLFLCLFWGLIQFFTKMEILRSLVLWLRQTNQYMDEASRKRLLQNRQMLQTLERENSFWFRLERQLIYSGLRKRFPHLTAERFIVVNVLGLSGVVLLFLLSGQKVGALLGIMIFLMMEVALFLFCKHRAMESVNDNLIKFLDFLGNYSITAGEVTGIFKQVSRYVEEPLKSVLEECYYEAQTTGDTAMALLAMAEKIEHPKFKELVRNMEVSLRYSADFTILVQNSRRSMREHLRTGAERKSLLREAVVNMGILLLMSFVIFFTVDGMITASIWEVLFHTLPGKIALGVLAVIFILFGRQIYRINQ